MIWFLYCGNLNDKNPGELGHLDIVRLLLEKKSDKNAQDRVGSTALTRAATAGQLEIVRFLVSARADIDKFDRLNGTALKYAASKGHAQIVRFLLSKQADISTADWLGMTAVRWASCRGHTEARELLVDAGADESGYVPTRFVMCVLLISSAPTDSALFSGDCSWRRYGRWFQASANQPSVTPARADRTMECVHCKRNSTRLHTVVDHCVCV